MYFIHHVFVQDIFGRLSRQTTQCRCGLGKVEGKGSQQQREEATPPRRKRHIVLLLEEHDQMLEMATQGTTLESQGENAASLEAKLTEKGPQIVELESTMARYEAKYDIKEQCLWHQ
ncbi:hypothetical protein GOP47_0016036 [Adiantum capillus-veneris]|uniref:Uncharacterized protein n=1 Tax=Adiantum capillus-veneris TaxID=13818 RepID=A0A9D4UKT4_ADICA|nr:hypothetical protein GOP47_0016036 [Adiantum capillus-veneris]